MSDEQLDEYDVAVVVFCRARGVDESDAEDRAKLAVRHTLAGGKIPRVPIEVHGFGAFADVAVQVADVAGLRYVGGQGIRLTATAEPYQNAGMGKPKKGKPTEQIIAFGTPDITVPQPPQSTGSGDRPHSG